MKWIFAGQLLQIVVKCLVHVFVHQHHDCAACEIKRRLFNQKLSFRCKNNEFMELTRLTRGQTHNLRR